MAHLFNDDNMSLCEKYLGTQAQPNGTEGRKRHQCRGCSTFLRHSQGELSQLAQDNLYMNKQYEELGSPTRFYIRGLTE